MKWLFRLVGILIFIVFFGFALKNTEEASLRFFLGYEVHAPLVLLLLAFFAAGAALGVMAMTPTVLRYRRRLAREKKAALVAQKATSTQLAPVQPPNPDAFS
ncbi:MAG: LapA family protein [Noviherbaspirillum sp.]